MLFYTYIGTYLIIINYVFICTIFFMLKLVGRSRKLTFLLASWVLSRTWKIYWFIGFWEDELLWNLQRVSTILNQNCSLQPKVRYLCFGLIIPCITNILYRVIDVIVVPRFTIYEKRPRRAFRGVWNAAVADVTPRPLVTALLPCPCSPVVTVPTGGGAVGLVYCCLLPCYLRIWPIPTISTSLRYDRE